jgi:hypothetical protein
VPSRGDNGACFYLSTKLTGQPNRCLVYNIQRLFLTAEECVEVLKSQQLRKIDDLPEAVGVYALADHLGHIHYIGITEAGSFRDRIYSRHVNGSEERSHKLACNYNIGRMWRDRKSADHVPRDARIAKNLRREFIRRHCFAACVPLAYTKQALGALERQIFAIVPPDMISWNATRLRVNCVPEPRDLVHTKESPRFLIVRPRMQHRA